MPKRHKTIKVIIILTHYASSGFPHSGIISDDILTQSNSSCFPRSGYIILRAIPVMTKQIPVGDSFKSVKSQRYNAIPTGLGVHMPISLATVIDALQALGL